MSFIIYFDLLSMGLSRFHDSTFGLRGQPESVQYFVVSIFILKKFILNIFSESNYIFTSHLSYLWIRQGDRIKPGQSPHDLNLFSTRKNNNNI